MTLMSLFLNLAPSQTVNAKITPINIVYWSHFYKFFSGTLTNHKSSRQVSQFLAQLSKNPGVHEINLQKPLQGTLHSDQ
jgi:hypothetical protein